MTVVKINAITVPADSADELGRRFAARAGAVDGQPGYEGFELLQPTDDRTTWLVITRWADEASFEAWTAGQDFAKAHGSASGVPSSQDHGGAGTSQRPVGMSAELWSYTVSTSSSGRPQG